MRGLLLTRLGLLAAMASHALASFAPPAAALEYQRIPLGSAAVAVFARGIILPGDAEALSAFIAGLPPTDHVSTFVVDSPGGYVAEAEKLAAVIRKNRLSALVPSRSQCSSACFLLFAAASGRFAAPDAVIGLHRVSLVNGEETDACGAATTDMARELARDGVPDAIVGKLVATPPGHSTWLSASDLASMGVQFVDDPRWR